MIPFLPADKANHFFYGSLIFLAALAAFKRSDVAYSIVLFAAVGKEAVDWLINQRAIRAGLPPPHGVEFFDALATCAGGAAPLLARMI